MQRSHEEHLALLSRLWAQRLAGAPEEPRYPFGQVPMTEYVRRWAAERPEHPAIIFYGHCVSYRELNELSDRFANLMAAQGIRAGDRVAVLMQNCPQFVISFLGILKAGCVYVPISPMFKQAELEYELRDCGASVVVASRGHLQLLTDVAGSTSVRLILSTGLSDFVPAEPSFAPALDVMQEPDSGIAGNSSLDLMEQLRLASPAATHARPGELDELAALNYTGGTTGVPKGCEHTQRHMVYKAAVMATYDGYDSQDVHGIVYGLFWIAGENVGLLLPLFTGATAVLYARWDAHASAQAVERHGISTQYGTVETFVELGEAAQQDGRDLSSLVSPLVAAFVRPLDVEVRMWWRTVAGEQSTIRLAPYGMTETHTCDTTLYGATAGDFDLSTRRLLSGVPMPGTRVVIADFESGEWCDLEEEGEILISSPSALTSYWQNPSATAELVRDGWVHTGDRGVIDSEGWLHYLGRNKDMIKVNGMSVFPEELETLLVSHPAIGRCAVIGVEDANRGERPMAFVTPAGSETTDVGELTVWVKKNISAYKVPLFRSMTELPLTATGKIDRRRLRELAAEQPPNDDRSLPPHLGADPRSRGLAGLNRANTDEPSEVHRTLT